MSNNILSYFDQTCQKLFKLLLVKSYFPQYKPSWPKSNDQIQAETTQLKKKVGVPQNVESTLHHSNKKERLTRQNSNTPMKSWTPTNNTKRKQIWLRPRP